MARTTQVSMEWTELTTHRDGERWGAIRSKATGDVARWLTDGPEAGSPQLATSTV
ncbi:hypothetical protein PF008_g33427 [Phytophthora fragariae]|nr:hypothetical protein PF008_g33427 [Phytophthora fragariae]